MKRPHIEYFQEDVLSSLVLEMGAWKVTGGFSGDTKPTVVRSSAISSYPTDRRPHAIVPDGSEILQLYDGTEFRVEEGKKHISRISNTLQIEPKETPVIIVDPPGIESKHRYSLFESLLEENQHPAVALTSDAASATYSYGKDKAVVIDGGHRETRATVVFDGYILKQKSKILPFGGIQMTDNWKQYFSDLGHDIKSPLQYLKRVEKTRAGKTLTHSTDPSLLPEEESEVLKLRQNQHQSVQEQVLTEYYHSTMEALGASSTETVPSMVWELPDGKSITVNDDIRRSLGGALFQSNSTSKFTSPEQTLQDFTKKCIFGCDASVRSLLCPNILLKGGVTTGESFSSRFQSELSSIFPPSSGVSVLSDYRSGVQNGPFPPSPDYTSWLGSSIIGSVSSFLPQFVSKSEWDEVGSSVVDLRVSSF